MGRPGERYGGNEGLTMHPRFLADRAEAAQRRIEAAAVALGGDPERVAVFDRDPPTRTMLRLEAVADLLEEVAAKKSAEAPPEPAAAGKGRGR